MKYPESESNQVELKRELPKHDQVSKTIIGFCNQHGGKLVIGVADDRNIIGLAEKEIENAMESIERSIYDSCVPHIIPRLYIQRLENKVVLVIEVSEGMNKPYYRRTEGSEKGTYIRLGKHTLRATPEIIEELKWQSIGVDFEVLPVYRSSIDDLDLIKIKDFLKNRKNHAKLELSDQVMHSYNLITYEHSKRYPTATGILLFGKNPQVYFSEAIIICTHFRGISGREVIATVDCLGTLFDQFKQAYAFITERLYSSFTIKSPKRDEKLEIPEIAIREILLNMIVHRNYHIVGPSKIAIFDDRIEFFSPGQFPGPMNINNLLTGITYLRNPSICKVMREANYIEKLGSGFITLFTSYEKWGLKTPQVIEGENYIKCTLPRKLSTKKPGVKDAYEKILELFSKAEMIDVKDVIQELSVSRATAVRKLNELIERNQIERIGSKSGTRYKIS